MRFGQTLPARLHNFVLQFGGTKHLKPKLFP